MTTEERIRKSLIVEITSGNKTIAKRLGVVDRSFFVNDKTEKNTTRYYSMNDRLLEE